MCSPGMGSGINRGKEAGLDVFRGGPLGIHCYTRNKTCSQGAGKKGVRRGGDASLEEKRHE